MAKATGLSCTFHCQRCRPYRAASVSAFIRSKANDQFSYSCDLRHKSGSHFGLSGLFSLGHAACFGVAAYSTGILIVHYGVKSFWISAPSSVLTALLVAAVFGLIALRVSGIYFLLITCALGQLVSSVAMSWYSMTGGELGLRGVPPPDLGLHWLTWNAASFYYFVFLAFVICYFLLYLIVNSPFGHTLRGIREGETRMQSLGYNTWLHKYVAFIVAGGVAGIGGVLFAHYNGTITPDNAGFIPSASVMLCVIMGSPGTLFGPVLGAAVMTFVEFYASIFTPERWPLILGAMFVAAVMYARGGIGVHLNRLWSEGLYKYGEPKS